MKRDTKERRKRRTFVACCVQFSCFLCRVRDGMVVGRALAQRFVLCDAV